MDDKELDEFEKVEGQLKGFHEEVQNLAKKSPDDGVNKFKLGHINSVLRAANKLMKPAQRPFPDFEQFNVDDVPTNSDVLLILRQYANCFEEVRSANVSQYAGLWYWLIDGERSGRRARPPAKLK
jgi:hypothetical protein